jgi:hypothetical protein
MAVPAQVLRLRGAEAASELARAGTIEVLAWDVVLRPDWRLGRQPILNAQNYTSLCETVNDFL